MKHKYFLITLFFTVVLILLVQNVWGQVPQTMSYQGVLMKAKGTLVQNGQYNLTFKLYDAAEGGEVFWSETQTVQVEEGLFNAALGSMNSLDIPFDRPYWLAVIIGDGEEVSRRMQLTSSAYSLQAQTVADKAITRKKIADGQVVRSINSVTDNVKLTAGENVTITQEGDEVVISASFPRKNKLDTFVRAQTTKSDKGAPEVVFNENVLVNGSFGVKDPISGNFTMAVLNDQVGIGTIIPQDKLHVNVSGTGGIQVSGDGTGDLRLVWGRNPGVNHFIFDDNDDGHTLDIESGSALAFNTSGSNERMRIEANGDVGIGTLLPLPQGKFSVTGNSFIANFISTNIFGLIRLNENATPRTTLGYGSAGHILTNALPNSTALLAETGALHLTANTIAENGMTVTTTGNVGIGTTAPQNNLHIEDIFAQMRFTSTNEPTSWLVGGTNGGFSITELGSGSRTFFEAGGEVGIGTLNPSAKLHIDGDDIDEQILRLRDKTDGAEINFTPRTIRQRLTNLRIEANEGDIELRTNINGGGPPSNLRTRLIVTKVEGNIGFGTQNFGLNAAGVLGIGNGTQPTSSPLDMVQLYAVDDAASSELRVRDEAGNVTTLSPHNFSMTEKSEPMAWSFYSENHQVDQKINVDMLKAVRWIEKISGEKLIHIDELNSPSDSGKKTTKSFESKGNGLLEKIDDLTKENEMLKAKLAKLETALQKLEAFTMAQPNHEDSNSKKTKR